MSPRGVKPDRAQDKPFHGLRIAPPSVSVIATDGTKTARRIPGVFKR